MKIKYEVTCEDVMAFNIEHLKKTASIKKLQGRNRNAIASLYALIAIALFIYESTYWPFAWMLMFIAILWFLFYPKAWELRVTKKIRKIFKDKESIVNELEFNNDGIRAKSAKQEGLIPWTAVKRIISGDQYLFLYLTDDDAIIIPRKEVEDFLIWEELSSCIKSWGEKNRISIGFSN